MISASPFDWSYLYPNKSKNKPYKNLKRHAKNPAIAHEPYACILNVHIQAWQHVFSTENFVQSSLEVLKSVQKLRITVVWLLLR